MANKRMLGAGVALALLLVVILAVTPSVSKAVVWWAGNQHPWPFHDVDEVGTRARLTFPPGSRLVDGEWFGNWNIYGYARVTLPPDRLEEFLAQGPFLGNYKRSDVPLKDNPIDGNAHNPELVKRWRLSQVQRSIHASGGHLDSGGHIPVTLFIDLDDPQAPLAHLHWYN